MLEWINSDNPVIVRGDGFYLIDEHGKRYLDGIASMWCNVWGHGNNEMSKTMVKQVRALEHSTLFGLANAPSSELAEMLIKLAKGMSHVFYSDNGSTAIEVGMKMAIQYWKNKGKEKKTKFISMQNGYHGDTVGAMSVGYLPRVLCTLCTFTAQSPQDPITGSQDYVSYWSRCRTTLP